MPIASFWIQSEAQAIPPPATFLFLVAPHLGMYLTARESAEFITDFDQLYHSAHTVTERGNPYQSILNYHPHPIFCPPPAVLVVLSVDRAA
jgi:hypothetical protein